MRVHHVFGNSPLSLGQLNGTNAAGEVLTVTRCDYLLSEFSVVTADGQEQPLTDQFAFVSMGSQRDVFQLTGIPDLQCIRLKFRVGLPAEVNHSDPAAWSAEHPLNPIVCGLHWSWQGGYVFLALEGALKGPDNALGGYSYHLATDVTVMRVSTELSEISKTSRVIDLVFDLSGVFSGTHRIEVNRLGTSTHSRSNDPLLPLLRENVVGSFRCSSMNSSTGPEPLHAGVGLRDMSSNATPYKLSISRFFPTPRLPLDNPLTEEGVALGRRLFHEAALSVDGTKSCASCHQQQAGFSDAGNPFSQGVGGKHGTRNAMSLANLAWQTTFFWDGRASSLREQVLQPIVHPLEMAETLPRVIAKLRANHYAPAFACAFQSNEITSDRIARALEQYLLTLVSHHSKFDRVLAGEEKFTAEEQHGFELFHTEYDPRVGKKGADCFHCHGGPLFSDFAFHNNGLNQDEAGQDPGRSGATSHPFDRLKFKTPSLRNVAVTGPYMHDGRFKSLEDVMGHYVSGVKRGATLDPNLAKHPEGGVPLSREDQRALVAFLKCLTDERFTEGGTILGSK